MFVILINETLTTINRKCGTRVKGTFPSIEKAQEYLRSIKASQSGIVNFYRKSFDSNFEYRIQPLEAV